MKRKNRGERERKTRMEKQSCLRIAEHLRDRARRIHTVVELNMLLQERILERDYWLELFECKDKKLAAELIGLYEWNKNDMLIELYEMLLEARPNARPGIFVQCARRFEIMAETYF